MLVSFAYKYLEVFDKTCGILYNKIKGPSRVGPWRTPQFMVPASKNTVPPEMKNALSVR